MTAHKTLMAKDYIELIAASDAFMRAKAELAHALARLREFPADAVLGKCEALIIADDTLDEEGLRDQIRKLRMALREKDPDPERPDITVVYNHRPVLQGLEWHE